MGKSEIVHLMHVATGTDVYGKIVLEGVSLIEVALVTVVARVVNQVRKTSGRWSLNRPNPPDAIATDFGEAMALLTEQPDIGAKYEGSQTLGGCRLLLSRVGCFIYYKADNDFLHELAYWQASRENNQIYKLAQQVGQRGNVPTVMLPIP